MKHPARVAPMLFSHALCSVVALSALLAGCGGGDDDGNRAPTPASTVMFPGDNTLANNLLGQCAVPRTGINPATSRPYPDRAGSLLTEQRWLAAWTNDTYLWYDEVNYGNPGALPATTLAYFNTLKTPRLTPAGKAKDRFHFTYPTALWESALAGEDVGYGATWLFPSSAPPRKVVVAYTNANTPATAPTAALLRGTEILRIDNIDLVNDATAASVAILNAALFPSKAGETHQFVVRDPGATATRTVTLTAAALPAAPVQSVRTLASGTVGYLQFNEHIGPAEPALINAVNQLRTAQVSDLVIDVRYNGGGLLSIASQLAYMVAGPTRTAGKTFERLTFNNQYPSINPVTRTANQPTPFYTTTLGASSLPPGTALPTLNLGRVFVITGADTCSASEAIINGLRGAGVEVIQIGEATCGKPYGFYPTENCGTTYFSIQFKGDNALGFSDYTDGFVPQNGKTTGIAAGAVVPGCAVADDLAHGLGDPAEARLAAALQYRSTGTCPAVALASVRGEQVLSADGRERDPALALQVPDGHVWKKPFLMNRIQDR
ncbi:MAG: S41 family peptidase [Pseudomonadota bacterium]